MYYVISLLSSEEFHSLTHPQTHLILLFAFTRLPPTSRAVRKTTQTSLFPTYSHIHTLSICFRTQLVSFVYNSFLTLRTVSSTEPWASLALFTHLIFFADSRSLFLSYALCFAYYISLSLTREEELFSHLTHLHYTFATILLETTPFSHSHTYSLSLAFFHSSFLYVHLCALVSLLFFSTLDTTTILASKFHVRVCVFYFALNCEERERTEKRRRERIYNFTTNAREKHTHN